MSVLYENMVGVGGSSFFLLSGDLGPGGNQDQYDFKGQSNKVFMVLLKCLIINSFM